MYIDFYKYQATGNDFVMIDNRIENDVFKDEKIIQSLCDRRFGVGGDGLILVSEDPETDFKMRYFNADGKEASMCGNGGRSAVAFAYKLNMISSDHVQFTAVDGLHEAIRSNNIIKLKMIDVVDIVKNGDNYFIQTGSPHHVEFQTDIDEIDVYKLGRDIRNSKLYQPDGTNVNFLEFKDGIINIRTFERGVENETLSCGTGSVAATIAVSLKYGGSGKSYDLHAPGGKLKVSFERSSDGNFRNVWLEGPATFVFSGKFKI
ncbi:MAG: diaminopimelate epimerase [Bacteroidales bacterium]|nr:diaminopimelate epimerase [Bacteroidales bacterium]